MNHAEQLKSGIRDAVDEFSSELSERESLEAAMEVAAEWKMRLAELEDEGAGDEDGDEGDDDRDDD